MLVPFLHVVLASVSDQAHSKGFIRELRRRGLASGPNDLNGKTFDYVIIGGGQAGMVVANRLTEDPNINVAVIEAGPTGYDSDDASRINVPAANLYHSPAKTHLDWQYTVEAQQYLNGATPPWPRGKVLGGSSAINGLYYVRHSKAEQDAWANMIGGQDIWSWDKIYNAMKKAENFTGAKPDVADLARISWETSSHGHGGPVQISYTGKTYELVGAYINASTTAAAPYSRDPDSGNNIGTYVATSTINPANWTRSFARPAYFDPYQFRSNLNVLTGYMVTKIVFDNSDPSNLKATQVKFQKSRDGTEYTVNVGREAILSAGAINTPQLLQVSGVGDANLLKQNNVTLVLDLPGVGYNLQDHLAGGVEWGPKDPSQVPPQSITGDSLTDSYVNSAVAYVNGSNVMKDQWNTFLTNVKNNQTNAVNAYDAPDAVKQGYALTYQTTVDIMEKLVGTIELIFSLTFSKVQVQSALQHPLSRGSVLIKSNNVFDYPKIDPRYLEQSSDMDMLREGFKLARTVGQTAPLSNYLASETNPGTGVTSNPDWENFIRGRVGTEYHPCGTAAMLPREKGGVVDKNLLVYGTSNLRVVDASVIPVVLAAHFMSVIYGVAEIGSDLIKAAQQSATAPQQKTNNTSATGGAAAATASNNPNNNAGKKQGAANPSDSVAANNKGSNAASSYKASAVLISMSLILSALFATL